MIRPCDVCGIPYEAKRPNSRFCGGTCRQRAARGYKPPPANVVALSTVSTVPADGDKGPVEVSTLQVLTECERQSTPLGEAALALARRVDIGRDTGAGLAALVKQLESTLRSATVGVIDEASPLDKARDELAARRATRGA